MAQHIMSPEEQSRSQELGYPVKKDGRTGIFKEIVEGHTQGSLGVRIPNSTLQGGSTAFSANDRIPVNVDPEYADGYVFDPNTVPHGGGSAVPLPGATGHSVVMAAMNEAAPGIEAAPPSEAALQEARDLLDRASVLKEVEAAALVAPQAAAPVPVADDYVLRSYRQEIQELRNSNAELRLQVSGQAAALMADPPAEQAITKPTKKIVFDYGPPYGKMTANFHGIIRESRLLVLVWDTRFIEGNQYEPSDLGPSQPINVTVESRDELTVISLGLSFMDGHTCYSVLMIDDRQTQQEYADAREE